MAEKVIRSSCEVRLLLSGRYRYLEHVCRMHFRRRVHVFKIFPSIRAELRPIK